MYKSFSDGRGWHFCEQCDKPIPIYERGTVPEGYVSPELWKVVQESVEGMPGLKPIHRIVCNPCYIAAFHRQHPGVECQLKPEEGELPEWVSRLSLSQSFSDALSNASTAPSYETAG